ILLLMDNAPCHVIPESKLTNVKVVFFPPNTTCETQPLDAGIIKNFKVKYRKYLIGYLVSLVDSIEGIDASNALKRVDMKMAVEWMKRAWGEVTQASITNCFRHCGIHKDTRINLSTAVEESQEEVVRDYGEVSDILETGDISELSSMLELIGIHSTETFDEGASAFDASVSSWEESILDAPIDDGNQDEEEQEVNVLCPPRLEDVHEALAVLDAWAVHTNSDIVSDVTSIRMAVAKYRTTLPDGRIDTWLL
ncbi:hypothetical protein LEN26_003013, partial [Aphanomyces euteiches]